MTIKSAYIRNGYNSSVILANPLAVVGGTLGLASPGGSIRGSAPGAPAIRGTLTISSSALFAYNAGDIENVTLNVVSNSSMSVFNSNTTGARNISGSDISIASGCKLDWRDGNVNITSPGANSHLTIEYGGQFIIGADSGTWGMVTYTDPAYFGVHNRGTVRVNSTGRATIVGNYDTSAVTQIDAGLLHINGLTEQTGGFFDLRNNSTIQVSGPKNLLHIRSGSIIGDGIVSGNLLLGDVPVYGPPQMAYPSIAPGHPSPPGMPPVLSLVGTLTITAHFQMVTGSMIIDVLADGTYDKVIVQGPYAALAGDLLVSVNTAYKPQGASLAFLTATSFIGDFATKLPVDANWYATNGKGFYRWRYVKGATSYILEAFLTGG